jgi:hypothetical protein
MSQEVGGPEPGAVFAGEVAEKIEAEVAVLDAWFSPIRGPADFAEGAQLQGYHLPGVRLDVAFRALLHARVVDEWTQPEGTLSTELLDQWCRRVLDLASLLSWTLRPPLDAAVPEDVLYVLFDCVWISLDLER